MKPETYFGHLIDHWSLLTDLYRESRGQSFHENLFLKVAKRHDPTNFSMESGHLLLNALRKTTILELVPMSNKEFEFSQNALMNIEHWLSEQKLSLQAELVVRVEALQNLTSKIESSIDDHDLIKYHNTCNEMDRLLRAIKTQTDEAKVAVFRLVEEAKLFPKEMPLKKRYEKALDAWTTFVEPVVNMCNPNDQFSKTLSLIENTISVWIADDSLIMLSLESDKKRLEVIKARIIDFQDAIEMAASIMAKTITPIIKMIRLNTTITKGATLGLKILENSGPSKEWIAQMGMGITKVKSSIRHGNTAAIESFMLEIKHYDDSADTTPRISTSDLEHVSSNRKTRSTLSEHEVVNFMKKSLPADDIYQLTISRFPDISAKMLLHCMAKLMRTPGYMSIRNDDNVITIERDNTLLTFSNRSIVKVTE